MVYPLRSLVVVAGLAVAAPGLAASLQRTQSAVINPEGVPGTAIPALTGPVGTTFTNGISKGLVKTDNRCNFQLTVSGLGLPDTDGKPGTGDEVICLGDAHVRQGTSNANITLITRGEVRGGKLSIRANLATETHQCVPTGGGSNSKQFDSRLACYEPQPSYKPTITFPFASDSTQGLVVGGSFAPRPTTPIVLTSGTFSQ